MLTGGLFELRRHGTEVGHGGKIGGDKFGSDHGEHQILLLSQLVMTSKPHQRSPNNHPLHACALAHHTMVLPLGSA